MNYEESELLYLLNKQDIDMLFLKSNSYLCQTKSLFEEKEQLQQENEQLKIQISAREEVCNRLENNWNKLKEYIKETKLKEFEKSYGKRYGKTFTQAEIIVCNMILDKMQEIEGSDSNEIMD